MIILLKNHIFKNKTQQNARTEFSSILWGGMDMVMHGFNSGIWVVETNRPLWFGGQIAQYNKNLSRKRRRRRMKKRRRRKREREIRVSKMAQWAEAHSLWTKLRSSERTTNSLTLCTISHPTSLWHHPYLHIFFPLDFLTQHKVFTFHLPVYVYWYPHQKFGASAKLFRVFCATWTLGTKIKRNDKFTPPSMHSSLLFTKFL